MSPQLAASWKERLARLEPVLKSPNLAQEISIYQGAPFAIFVYPPAQEFPVRQEVKRLATRIEQESTRRVTVISMVDELWAAIKEAHPPDSGMLFEVEKQHSRESADEPSDDVAQHMLNLLTQVVPLADRVAARLAALDASADIAFIQRVGALFPSYRASALLENLMGRTHVPTVLFYPGSRSGPSHLRFMDSLDSQHGYRCKIF